MPIFYNIFKSLATLPIVALISLFPSSAEGCTSGLFGRDVTPDGRILLWKHRDTSAVDNKVEYIAGADGEFSFVGLFNASDKDLREVWAGFNEAGFAVINTASYNIKDDDVPEKDMDREGLVMSLALRHCRTLDDFAFLLDSLPRPLGVEANFGAFDAEGNGAYFETNNHTFVRFDLSDQQEDYLIRTNYSHSGRPEEGYGFVREKNALHLLGETATDSGVTPEYLTETVSRSFYHAFFDQDELHSEREWLIDQDFIPRYKSSSVVVIEGNLPGADPSRGGVDYVMWTGLGYPPCSEILPVTCSPEGVDPSLRGIAADGHAPLSDLAKKRRDEVFPHHYGNGDKYIRVDRLVNDQGTGYLQVLVPQNLERYRRYREAHNR